MTNLYHLVPNGMVGKTIYPLNHLKCTLPAVYERQLAKYQGRGGMLSDRVPGLNCTWGDMVCLSAVHPMTLLAALHACGWSSPSPLSAFIINPEKLEPSRLVVYEFYRKEGKVLGRYLPFDLADLPTYDGVSEEITRAHYRDANKRNERPFLFEGITHILHRGPIKVTNCEIVTC